jgi:phage head maturation protease
MTKPNSNLKSGHKVEIKLSGIAQHMPEPMGIAVKKFMDSEDAVFDRMPQQFMIKGISEGDRTAEGYASTRRVDFDGDILMPKGCDTKIFQMNPVLMLGHNYAEAPIGKVTSIASDDFGVRVALKFADTKRATEYWGLVKNGFIRALSVGAYSTKSLFKDSEKTRVDFMQTLASLKSMWAELTEEDAQRCLRIIEAWNMLELSLVNVPNNAYSMLDAIKKGDLKLSDETMIALDLTEEPPAPKSFSIKKVVPFTAKKVNIYTKEDVKTMVNNAISDSIKNEVAKRRGSL